MALTPRATHVLQWSVQRAAKPRGGVILKSRPQFGLESATRLREVGIASNRESECHGEYVPGPIVTGKNVLRSASWHRDGGVRNHAILRPGWGVNL